MKNYFLVLTLFALGCATIKAPTGGDKDEDAPKVLNTNPDSAALMVRTNEIIIEFDEFVKTKDANNLLIISPNPPESPEFVVRKKTLHIKFADTLRANTTYNIMINGSVVDVNEGNPLDDYQLTFSTGQFLDSLSYSAMVIDAYTRNACDHCAILMYGNNKDSLILSDKPDYIARTRGNGTGLASFLPKDSFLVFAIEDENKNLKLDPGEKVSLGVIRTTDRSTLDSLYIFPYYGKQTPLAKPLPNKYPGIFKFSLDKTYYGNDLRVYYKRLNSPEDSTFVVPISNYSRDTFTCYISTKDLDTGYIFVQIDSSVRDYRYQVQTPLSSKKAINVTFPESGKLTLRSKQLIDSVVFSDITLYADSMPVKIDSFRKEDQLLHLYFKHTDFVKLILPAGCITDINGTPNLTDTVKLNFTKSDPSILSLQLALPDSGYYLLQILKDDKVVYQTATAAQYTHVFKNLEQGTYRVRIITDHNQNEIWDPGDIFLGLPPEPVYLSEKIDLRPSWDKELIINSL